MVNHDKDILRKRILTLLSNQKEEQRSTESLIIQDKLFKMPEFQKAKTILFYASFDGEVNTFTMMRRAKNLGKNIGLPTVIKESRQMIPRLIENFEKDLEKGSYGIKEPNKNLTKSLNLEHMDMVIVPGVAFDKNNNRLGRGGGYYDRFLKTIPSHIPTIGLAFHFQLIDHLPHQENDIPVFNVITN